MNIEFQNKVDYILKTYTDKTAMTYMRDDGTVEKYTFGEIREFISQVKVLFNEIGLRKGDRAAIVTPHSPYGVMAGMILAYLNITIVLIDTSLPTEEVNKLLAFSDVRAVITTDAYKNVMDKNLTNNLPYFLLGKEHCPIELVENCAFQYSLPPTKDLDTDIIAIIFSSGTTGEMKGVMVTYYSIMRMIQICTTLSGVKDNMTNLCVLPFNHIGGMSNAFTYLLNGCECAFIENMSPLNLQKGLQIFKPHFFVMVPKVFEVFEQKIKMEIKKKRFMSRIIINFLFQVCGFFRKYFGINLGYFIFRNIRIQAFGDNIYGLGVGASPCKPETEKFFLNMGLKWANLYASTETNVPITSSDIFDKYPVGNVGNINKHDGIKILIRNQDSDGIGEVLVKTDLIMKGYFKQPDLTQKAFDENGYFKTGDYGYIDKKGYLHLTGRVKESIILKSGKKVSPSDVDEYYALRTNGLEFASRGIAGKENYDEIHLFIEDKNYSSVEREDILRKIQNISRQAPSMYKVDAIHFIPQIPKTAVGKVKRFCLNIEDDINITSEKDTILKDYFAEEKSLEEILDAIINKVTNNEETRKYKTVERLKQDIGMDSLNIFEMCVALQEQTGVSAEGYLHDSITVGELLNLLKKQDDVKCKEEDITGYSLKKTERTQKNFQLFKRLSNHFWDIEVYGTERIDFTQQYIYCPNHESHFDGLWIMSCLPDTVQEKICSMAADYLFEKRVYRFGVEIMGGIPVHRDGNTTLAMKRIYDCLTKEGYSVLIHPEGTRTRDGKLGDFKLGAARLAKQTGVKCIPVHIEGAREIYPPDRKYPRISKKNGNKRKLVIRFGSPINSEGKTEQEIIDEIRKWMGA